MTKVKNLETGRELVYSCTPREAVMAAYAQDLGDFNTWDYEQRYGDQVKEGDDFWFCGNFAAEKKPS